MMDVISERIGAMIESVRSRNENEILEGKLQRSQKMEAIGMQPIQPGGLFFGLLPNSK